MTTPDPMAMQWSNADQIVTDYVQHLRQNPTTTSDIAIDLLTTDHVNIRVLAMIGATALQQLAAVREGR